MNLSNWLNDVTAGPPPDAVESVWDGWLSGEPLDRLPALSGLAPLTVGEVLRSRPPPSFRLSTEPVSGEACAWFAVEGLTGPGGEAQPMAFLVPPRLYAPPVLRRASALVTRSLARTHPGATPCWDIMEDVDHATCSVMHGRGFLAWTFDQAGEVREGTS